MRTRSDLDAAFAILEREADANLTDALSARPAPRGAQDVPRRTRTAVTALSAAAVVVGAVAIGLAVSGSGSSSSPAGNPTSPLPSSSSTSPTGTATVTPPVDPLRSLAFAAALPPAYRIATVSTAADGSQVVGISYPGGVATLTVDPPSGVDRQVATGQAESVDINGRPGWYGDGIGLTYTVPVGSSSSPGQNTSVDPGSAAPNDPGQRAVAWRYDGSAYAVLLLDTPTLSKEQLLTLARSIDFSATTPVRVAFALHDAPAGLALTRIDSPSDGDRTYAHPDTSTGAFTLTGHADAIQIQVSSATVATTNVPAEDRVTVNGHPGAFVPGFGSQLQVDLGDGESLLVTAVLPADGSSLSRDQMLQIARAVTVAPDPTRPATWFDATTALP